VSRSPIEAARRTRAVLRHASRDSRGGAIQRTRKLLGRKPRAHLIHPGKTGGTALKAALRPHQSAGRYELVLHPHKTTLAEVPPGEKMMFVVRDPVERYVSAFNSRLRQGLPRYHIPWSPAEQAAFEAFSTADELARALSSPSEETRTRAYTAMSTIKHVRDSYWRWFIHGQILRHRQADLLMIAWLPDLTESFPRICERLGLPPVLELPSDAKQSHRSPADVNTFMSELAIENMRHWCARDYGFIDICAHLDCFIGPSWKSETVRDRSADESLSSH
jgi:hypothetical protein